MKYTEMLITNIIEHEDELKREREASRNAVLTPCNVELDDIYTYDAPDFCDAYIKYCEHEDGTPFSDAELDRINENGDLIHEMVINEIY